MSFEFFKELKDSKTGGFEKINAEEKRKAEGFISMDTRLLASF